MDTQWRHSPSGVITGMDYNVLKTVMAFNDLSPDHQQAFKLLRAMERETIQIALSKIKK